MISQKIIKLASDTKFYGLKKNSKFIATCKNKLCGDKITVEIELNKNFIKEMHYETESCIFCQASASVLSKIVKKKDINKILLEVNKITNLNNSIPKFKGIFKNFQKLYQIKYKERFSCISLPLNAFTKALNAC